MGLNPDILVHSSALNHHKQPYSCSRPTMACAQKPTK